ELAKKPDAHTAAREEQARGDAPAEIVRGLEAHVSKIGRGRQEALVGFARTVHDVQCTLCSWPRARSAEPKSPRKPVCVRDATRFSRSLPPPRSVPGSRSTAATRSSSSMRKSAKAGWASSFERGVFTRREIRARAAARSSSR